MKLRILAISVLLALTFSNASAQVSPELQDRLDQRPNTTRIDVIILNEGGASERAIEAVKNAGGNISHRFEIIDGVSATIPKIAAGNIANRRFIREVQPDYNVNTVLSESADTVNAREVWNQNITGEGIDVAVLDTGIEDNTVLDVQRQTDFTDEGTDDLNGHGTHVAGIVASPDDQYRGIAYGADLFDVKVIDRNGTGKTSDVISGLDYAVENGAEVATLSLGANVRDCDGTSAISEAVDNAVEQGITVTVAAGNSGPENRSLNAPGCAEKPITVGSSGRGEVSDFSSRGPTSDGRSKPDIVAPGERITSLTNNRGDGPSFESLSGTSMATPHVAGATALLLSEENLKPSELKKIIQETADDLGYSSNAQGAGRIDIYQAYQAINNKTEENRTENRSETTGNSIPVIEADDVEVKEVNGSLEARMSVEVRDRDNDSLEASFYFEGQEVSQIRGYGELSHTESNLSRNSTYTWRAEATDGINTSSTERLEFTTEQERDEENSTSNRTGKRLPSQASETARKATSGFFNPNSPFYSLDIAVDRASVALGIRSREKVMEERAQEARKMAESGDEEAAGKAIRNLRETSGNGENASREASETLEKAIETAPEKARDGLRKALENVEKERKTQKESRKGEETKNSSKDTDSDRESEAKDSRSKEQDKEKRLEKKRPEDRNSTEQEKRDKKRLEEKKESIEDNNSMEYNKTEKTNQKNTREKNLKEQTTTPEKNISQEKEKIQNTSERKENYREDENNTEKSVRNPGENSGSLEENTSDEKDQRRRETEESVRKNSGTKTEESEEEKRNTSGGTGKSTEAEIKTSAGKTKGGAKVEADVESKSPGNGENEVSETSSDREKESEGKSKKPGSEASLSEITGRFFESLFG